MKTVMVVKSRDNKTVAKVEFVDQPDEPNYEFYNTLRDPTNAYGFGKQTSIDLRWLFNRMYPNCSFHVTREQE